MFLLSVILSVIILDGNGTMGIGGLGALLFYCINKWIFVKEENEFVSNDNKKITQEEKEKMVIENSDIKIETGKENDKATTEKFNKVRYCKICGEKIDKDKKCKKCGKQYFNIKKIKMIYIIIVLLFASISINIYQLILFNNKNNEISKLEDEVLDLLGEKREIALERNNYEDKANFLDENIVFVLEGYGDYYYTYDCVQRITDGDYYYWVYTDVAAKSKGYKKGSCY